MNNSMKINRFAPALALLMALGAPLSAKPMLKDVPEVFDRILTGAIVNEIFTKCATINPRKLKATLFVIGTVNYAKKLGYTMDDIDELRSDSAQEKRLNRAVDAYLRANGVNKSQPETYCALGFAEMENKSLIGSFLKRAN